MRQNRTGMCRLAIVMLGAGMMLAGCGGVATEKPYGSASIVSEPPNAKVVNMKDGSAIGTTPMLYTWKTKDGNQEYIQLILAASGHADHITEFFINPQYENKDDAEKNPQAIKVNIE
jgi:hypothetical protein